MKFEEAVVRSIRSFLDGKMAKETGNVAEQGKIFYTPAYFDAYEEAIEDGDFDEVEEDEEELDDDA
tara:strand:+ start:4249 stop:4446 length:198 start_codon:yes stop_codon:yes gene_type:complete